jgi:hypothetical protein
MEESICQEESQMLVLLKVYVWPNVLLIALPKVTSTSLMKMHVLTAACVRPFVQVTRSSKSKPKSWESKGYRPFFLCLDLKHL